MNYIHYMRVKAYISLNIKLQNMFYIGKLRKAKE